MLSDGKRIIEEDSVVALFEAMQAPLEDTSDGAELAEFCKWLKWAANK